jgi:hypothetical protein
LSNTSFKIDTLSVKGPAETNSVGWKSHEVHVFDNGAEMLVSVKYMPSKYLADGARNFVDTFLSCMEALVTNPEATVLR